MKTSDIQVGKIYRHLNHPHARYLGCGLFTNFTNSQLRGPKFLVVISSNDVPPGRKVLSKRDTSANFWDGFYITTEQPTTKE